MTQLIKVIALLLLFNQLSKAAEPALDVNLSVSRSDVSMSDSITLDVRLRNAGRSPLTVLGDLGWGEGGGFTIHVSPWGDDGPLPLFRDHGSVELPSVPDHLVELRGEMFIGVRSTIYVRDLFRTPGRYTYGSNTPARYRPLALNARSGLLSTAALSVMRS